LTVSGERDDHCTLFVVDVSRGAEVLFT